MSLKFNVQFYSQFLKGSLIALGICLTSCTNDFLPELSLDTISIYTDMDANENSATAVDLVIIYDQELEKTMSKLSAAKYFSSSKQLLLDNPTLLDIWHWELVPGQIVQDFNPPQEEGDAYAAFVFANYLTPGDHRLKVAPSGVVKILLQRKDLINLVAFDVHEVRTGVTMSSASGTKGEEGIDDDEDEAPQIKLGPTKDISSPCKKVAHPTQESGEDETDDGMCFTAPQAQRMPIESKPLCPPKAMAPTQTTPQNICPPKICPPKPICLRKKPSQSLCPPKVEKPICHPQLKKRKPYRR